MQQTALRQAGFFRSEVVAIPANDDPVCLTSAPVSPGPWEALTPTPCGAVPIVDLCGAVIGWATDAIGHTDETVMPCGRDPAQIATNARAMAAAWDMLTLISTFAELEPIVTARLMMQGAEPDPFLIAAAAKARAMRRLVHGNEPIAP
jgi:hypothetical protein